MGVARYHIEVCTCEVAFIFVGGFVDKFGAAALPFNGVSDEADSVVVSDIVRVDFAQRVVVFGGIGGTV